MRTGIDRPTRVSGPCLPSNWRNPQERQRVTIASCWDAVHELCFEMPDGPPRAYSPILLPPSNVWRDQQHVLRTRLACFQGRDPVRAARDLFYEHGGRVICVVIRRNQLRFVPMVNPEWCNDWPARPCGELDAHFKRKHAHVRHGPEPEVLPFYKWWAAGNLLCNRRSTEPHVMSDRSLVAVRHMLETVCASREVPDCCFFINIRDGAVMRRDNKKRPCPLPWRPVVHRRACAPDAFPMFGFNGMPSTHFDVPCPTDADWVRATQLSTLGMTPPPLPDVTVPLASKKPMAIWRGSLTGPGNSAQVNPRLALLALRSKWLDARCTSTNHERCRVCPVSKHVCSIDPTPFGKHVRSNFIPYKQQQEDYMVQVVVPGHAQAHRWPAALAGNQVVVRVQSEHTMWIDDVAIPGTHYVLAHTPDQVPALTQAACCDVKGAAAMAQAALTLSTRWTVDGIVDWWVMALSALPACSRVYTA